MEDAALAFFHHIQIDLASKGTEIGVAVLSYSLYILDLVLLNVSNTLPISSGSRRYIPNPTQASRVGHTILVF